ncbi:four helix bundle protein [Flexistipes sinusarabici]|uniref:four helix bundle protein n=1 Tax=Flexistipes sinusarabici TaxID=2352 RepID=UPI0026EAA255|nr:four helix bundle protein [Flexistipes sinusarabici]
MTFLERKTAKDRARFLIYAKGSCGELLTHIYIGIEAGYIEKDVGQEWIQETKELSKMIYGLTK